MVSRFWVAWIRKTIRNVRIVVPVLMTSCHVSLKPKRGRSPPDRHAGDRQQEGPADHGCETEAGRTLGALGKNRDRRRRVGRHRSGALAGRRDRRPPLGRADPTGRRVRSSSSVRRRPYEASPEVRRLANKMMDESIPADQSRLVPKIAWRRFIDLVLTGR